MKRIIAIVLLMAVSLNVFLGSSVPARAFELREGDIIEDDEDYAGMEFDESYYDYDDDENEVTDEDYDDALDLLEENNIDAVFKVVSSWQDHCNVEVTVTNSLDEKIEDWEVRFDLEAEVENIWNAKVTNQDHTLYTVKNADWNQDIEVGETATFGMTLKCAEDIEFPDKVFLTRECDEVLEEYEVAYNEYSRWDGNKVNGEITIKNLSDRVIDDWKLELESNIKIKEIWNAVLEEEEDHYLYLNNAGHNATIAANSSVTFGFLAEVDGDAEISEYYLYDMREVTDEETKITNELEDGYEREEDDFETDQQYQAYQVVAAKLMSTVKAKKEVKDDTTGFALPARKPKSVKLGKKGKEFAIKGIKVEYFDSDEDIKPSKIAKAKAIQSFAKLGEKYYITQRVGKDVFVSTCSKDKDVLQFDDNSTMRLKECAHGQTLEFIECGGKMYMLMEANVRKKFGQSLILVQYQAKKTVSYNSDNQDVDIKRITKLAYANQDRKYFARVGRVHAALSENNETLGIWFANDVNGDDKEELKTTKVQIACYKMKNIIKYFEQNPKAKSLSFQSMKKSWCRYSCQQKKKSQMVRPYGSNQGIEVSNTYKGKDKKGNEVVKNKIYISSGNQNEEKPLYISMMTLYKKSTKDLTKNGSYRTQMKIRPGIKYKDENDNELDYKHEMEGLHLYGDTIFFVIAPCKDEETDKSTQNICSIPRDYMKEANYDERKSKG